ncbi:MAG: VacJ family lipoprotein [Deltaproteobacteria bacterium]|nr:VacJ family lipoprotein [Deltaproteobacteria bacterium]
MRVLRILAVAMGLLANGLLSPVWSAPTRPLPAFVLPSSENEVIYLAQQKGVIQDAVERKQEEEDDLWEDEEGLFEDEEEELTIADPLYYVNKGIWHFNDFVFLYIGEPAARGYNKILPETIRGGVTNFFSNWYTPVRLVSCLLQAKWKEAGTEGGRFLINTTFGILGFADLAKEETWTGWEVADEDIGQVFGAWGIGQGFYLVLPLVGPSSARDTLGRIGNGFLDPLTYLDIKLWEYAAIWSYREFANYAPNAGEYKKFRDMSLDPYTAMRNAYIQYRARQVRE